MMLCRLSQEDLDQMGRLLAKMKKVAPTKPYPSQPATPPLLLTSDPLAAFLERVAHLGKQSVTL
jgi:hypothetical protein